RVLEKGGTLAINAIHMTPIPELDYELLYYEKNMRSVANVTRRDAREFLKIAEGIEIETEVEVFPLEDANRVLKLLKNSGINGAGVLKV
ncbi:alcohol dehydrogenase, partial [candidate division MSBL1 archaeon SCGC-AAA259I07]